MDDAPRPAEPLTRDAATALLDEAAELLAAGDFADAALAYRRAIANEDRPIRAAALLGLGESLYRLDDEPGAVATWESILELPENGSTYHAWRNVAAARVRHGDIGGAIAAYREAERRAPAEDKPEIASRLGWLAKETGNVRASRRYFAAARGAGPAVPVAYLVLGATIAVTLTTFWSADGGVVLQGLWLDKRAVADGEYWRLFTVTLVHANLIHLLLNGLALYITGPLVERLYGSRLFAMFYVLCALAGSVGSLVFGSSAASVGASGAVFGLIGVLFAASRAHHPLLDAQGRMLLGRLGGLIVFNLIFGFALSRVIDNAAHIGGLLAGLWLGLIFVPGRVPTLRSLWLRPDGEGPSRLTTMVLPTVAVVALVAVLAAGVLVGSDLRRSDPRTPVTDLGARGPGALPAEVARAGGPAGP